MFVFQPNTGLYSSSEFFANPALIPSSQQLAISNTLSVFKMEKAHEVEEEIYCLVCEVSKQKYKSRRNSI